MVIVPGIETERDALGEFCRRNGIRRLAVFGSALRDDFGPDSDIDLLVEFGDRQHTRNYGACSHGGRA